MPDALPVSEADAIAFVTALKAPLSQDLADRAFLSLASTANDGPKLATIDLNDVDSALGRIDGSCVWTVTGGDEAVAQQPPFDDTPPKQARAIQRVIDGYLAGVEVTATCTLYEELTRVEAPQIAIALAPAHGKLLIRGWHVFGYD